MANAFRRPSLRSLLALSLQSGEAPLPNLLSDLPFVYGLPIAVTETDLRSPCLGETSCQVEPKKCSGAISDLFGRISALRSGPSPSFCENASTFVQCFDGGSRPGRAFDQWRCYGAKAKKSKTRSEEGFDSAEDIGSLAKETAMKMMETALDALSREHAKLRTGRASAGMLDHIMVEVHGVRTPLSHIAAVTVSGLQSLNILPYDASMVKVVEKAILNSPLGLNPQVNGATLTVPLPRLTKEHCETMCKLVGKAGESAKLTIRRARKEALDLAKSSGTLSKDVNKRFEKEVEDLTKKYTREVDEACKMKEKEILG